MPIRENVVRAGDMHPNRALRVLVQSDGDVILIMEQDGVPIGETDLGDPKTRSAQVEFCVSGGRSPATHRALLELIAAMEEDNKARPIDPQ
jgi:hypothetical protein